MKHGDKVFVDDRDPNFGYFGPARFVKYLQPRDKDTKWSGWVHLLELEPHCVVHVKGDQYPSVFPTRCVKVEGDVVRASPPIK